MAASSKNVAFVSQIPHIAQTETVLEILSFSCNATLDSGDMESEREQRKPSDGAEADRVPSRDPDSPNQPRLSRANVITERVDAVLDTLNLSRVRNRQIRYLSGGELKRVSIAMQLCQSPDILVLCLTETSLLLHIEWPC